MRGRRVQLGPEWVSGDTSTAGTEGNGQRAGLRLPRFLSIRLGGIGVGMSSFRVIVIVEGSREWSRVGAAGGGARADGSLLGVVGGRNGRNGMSEWRRIVVGEKGVSGGDI